MACKRVKVTNRTTPVLHNMIQAWSADSLACKCNARLSVSLLLALALR